MPMTAVAEFGQMLSEWLRDQGMNVSKWSGGTRASNNLLCVSTGPLPTVLYVKVSNNTPGFWGLTRNQIECLEKSPVRWFAVLLHCAPNAGYILQGDAILGLISKGSMTLSADGDYKLNENHLRAMCRFKGIDDLATQAL